jgi:hypothetical protein
MVAPQNLSIPFPKKLPADVPENYAHQVFNHYIGCGVYNGKSCHRQRLPRKPGPRQLTQRSALHVTITRRCYA